MEQKYQNLRPWCINETSFKTKARLSYSKFNQNVFLKPRVLDEKFSNFFSPLFIVEEI